MIQWLLGGKKSAPEVSQKFRYAVRGEVVEIQRAQYFEEKCGGFDVEILIVSCARSGEKVACVQFSEQAVYGTVKKGQHVTVAYDPILDEEDYGTRNKVRAVLIPQ